LIDDTNGRQLIKNHILVQGGLDGRRTLSVTTTSGRIRWDKNILVNWARRHCIVIVMMDTLFILIKKEKNKNFIRCNAEMISNKDITHEEVVQNPSPSL